MGIDEHKDVTNGIEFDSGELEGIAGGADPETMTLAELNDLIDHFAEFNVRYQIEIDEHYGLNGAQGGLEATQNAVDELLEIRKRRFGV
ncbi:MAG: hypothetical protein IJ092_12155 [Atopobiaceae bacterium]|nr:hypothetical protein [Atopobiaceae bacterium]MBR1828120.1 hypothetical protein [Atopobiaceae bacterium]